VREVSRINAIELLNKQFDIFKAHSILDVGCGDGQWWKNVLPEQLNKVYGIDISASEIELAKQVIKAKCLDVTNPDFLSEISNQQFDLIIGNCSMEHIYHIDKALLNIEKALSANGVFILFVPTPYWAFKGKTLGLLHRVSPRLSMMYSGMINGFFQHWHLYHYQIWISLLNNFGFKKVEPFGLGNQKSDFLFRLFLPTSFISFIVKALTGKYLNYYVSKFLPEASSRWKSRLILNSLDNSLRPANANDIFEYILVCKK
jgi:SAM-dependent methyltransferase